MGETTKRTRADDTRDHLLAAAREVFEARGYRSATVAAITEVAETAHGTFYLHFRNKEEVFATVMASVIEELYQHSFTPIDQLPEAWHPRQSRDGIAGFVATFARHGPIWRALLDGALASPVVEARWMDQRRRFHQAIIDRIQRLNDMGIIEGVDAEVIGMALASMVEWTVFGSWVFTSPGSALDGVDEDRLVDALTDIFERSLGLA